MSVNYCIGNLTAKRKMFRAAKDGSICADNDDILGYFRLSGKLYCLPGDLPFGDMSAGNYVAYQRALLSNGAHALKASETEHILDEIGLKINPKRKIRTLTRLQFRHLTLATKWQPGVNTVYVNLDGLAYTRKNRKNTAALIKALSRKFEVYVAVSDSRFIPKRARILDCSGETPRFIEKPKKQKSVTVSKRVLTKFLMTRPYFGETLRRAEKPVLIS